MTDIKVLLVVKDPEAAAAYGQALARLEVAYDVVASFDQMSNLAVENAYNGLLIDILTLVRCSKEEKVIAYDCINLFPVLRVKWETREKKIQLSPLEHTFSPDVASALSSFIVNRCSTFPARRLRKHRRKPIHLNVLVSSDPALPEQETTRGFTINLSPGGMFLHTMEHFEKGEPVWLRLVDLADQTPVQTEVCWYVRWGEQRCIPGVGLRFLGLTERQEKELNRIYCG